MRTGAYGAGAVLLIVVVWLLMAIREPREVTAGVWFEPVSYSSKVLGGRLNTADFVRIEAVAREELAGAFQDFNLTFTDRRDARFRVRVVQEIVDQRLQRKTWIAGHSFATGFGGTGEVSFLYFASGALAYAPPDMDRPGLIDAIGRGLGRGAAHEIAHLAGFARHSRDRGSYDYYAASRPEQYFGPMHWDVAAPVLERRLGRRSPVITEEKKKSKN